MMLHMGSYGVLLDSSHIALQKNLENRNTMKDPFLWDVTQGEIIHCLMHVSPVLCG